MNLSQRHIWTHRQTQVTYVKYVKERRKQQEDLNLNILEPTQRHKQIAVIMIIATLTADIDVTTASKKVLNFRRKLRKYLEHLVKHENKLYVQSHVLSQTAWDEANTVLNKLDIADDLSTADSLMALNTLISHVKETRKAYSQTTFSEVYASLKETTKEKHEEEPTLLMIKEVAKSLSIESEISNRFGSLIKKLKEK